MSIAVVNWSSAAIAGRFAAGRPNGSEQSARKRFAAPRSPYAGWDSFLYWQPWYPLDEPSGRFTLESGIVQCNSLCAASARTGHSPAGLTSRLWLVAQPVLIQRDHLHATRNLD